MAKGKGHFPPLGGVNKVGGGLVRLRPGEGVAVQAHQMTEGNVRTISIALGSAPVPERRYAADVYFVTQRSDSIKLMFGQLKATGNALRSLLVIHTTSSGVEHLLSAVDCFTQPTILEIAERENISVEKVDTALEEPSQTVALSANMGIAAVSGRESCLDFYQASPFAIAAFNSGQEFAVDPVVRVDLTTALFLGFLGEARRISTVRKRELERETAP